MILIDYMYVLLYINFVYIYINKLHYTTYVYYNNHCMGYIYNYANSYNNIIIVNCKAINPYTYSETSLIRHLYNPTFSLIRPSYEVQSPCISMVRGTP